jgi:hypothetical protein
MFIFIRNFRENGSSCVRNPLVGLVVVEARERTSASSYLHISCAFLLSNVYQTSRNELSYGLGVSNTVHMVAKSGRRTSTWAASWPTTILKSCSLSLPFC